MGSNPGASDGIGDGIGDRAPEGPRSLLEAARRKCRVEAFDELLDTLRTSTQAEGCGADTWSLLAETLLERIQQRTHLLGVAVGEPIFDELPKELDQDVEQGLTAIARARELGEDSATLFRVEAGLMSQRITGLGSALKWNGKIAAALKMANERQGDDPLLHTALGLRKLLAPRMFGHDPDKALEHFEYAAEAMPADERPAVFAAMASYLQKKRQKAVAWLEKAVTRNPENRFARAVLKRLRRGEDKPFGRDVTAAELQAAEGPK
ncbi:MAG: tetratricopeptide repeat protein [Planctomycetota bacterium]